MRTGVLSILLAVSCATPDTTEVPDYVPTGFTLLWSSDFDRAEQPSFTFTDDAAWRIHSGDDNRALELFGKSKYKPPVRSPRNIAWIANATFGSFVLDADLRQTGREYGHRDMCVFFGREAADRFYYVHLASKADNHAHNVFRVDRRPRVKFADETTKGVGWGSSWHHVRIIRDADSGTIEVYFDDMQKPIMRARDTTFRTGQIGFGSFDDTGMIDNIRIWGGKKVS